MIGVRGEEEGRLVTHVIKSCMRTLVIPTANEPCASKTTKEMMRKTAYSALRAEASGNQPGLTFRAL